MAAVANESNITAAAPNLGIEEILGAVDDDTGEVASGRAPKRSGGNVALGIFDVAGIDASGDDFDLGFAWMDG